MASKVNSRFRLTVQTNWVGYLCRSNVKQALIALSIISILLNMSACSKEQTTPAEEHGAPEITIYSERKEHLIKPLFDKYTTETGVKIRYITDKAGPLISRLENEGEATPADILITVDAGNLWHATKRQVLRPIQSEVLESVVPKYLTAKNKEWFGLSMRARTIIYSTDRVDATQLSTYEQLADPVWKGKLCLRTSKKVYNQSLVATMIKTLGEEKTEEMVKGWVDNLATAPYSNDTTTMEAIVAGQCDVAIVNTYYYGRLVKQKPDTPLALFWPNQNDRGVHVNISGAGITKYAKQPEAAKKLIEWLASSDAQFEFAQLNNEYPVNPNVSAAPEVKAWGDFKPDLVNVEAAGSLQAAAVKLMDRAGYR